MMVVNGINHITFAVSDLERSLDFYVGLLGLTLVKKWDRGAYLTAGNGWVALNLEEVFNKETAADGSHIAFNVLAADYKHLKGKLENAGVDPFKENISEGASYYFLDPDGHKLELHYNTLEDRLNWAEQQFLGRLF
jgi:catechol 2,3-dioxygenase-like lactoylglutathione lyase family enzyme